jgi:hypothetical protein
MTQRFVAMLGCGSCHVRGCHESCSLRFASSDPHSLRFASSDPQAVIVRHRPKRSHATTANADRLIAGCLITSAAPLRLLLSISKYLQIGSTRIGVRFILASKLDCIFGARFAVVACERFGLCRTIAGC